MIENSAAEKDKLSADQDKRVQERMRQQIRNTVILRVVLLMLIAYLAYDYLFVTEFQGVVAYAVPAILLILFFWHIYKLSQAIPMLKNDKR